MPVGSPISFGLFKRRKRLLKLLIGSDVRHVVAGFDERRFPDHVSRGHVCLGGKLLRDFLRILCFL